MTYKRYGTKAQQLAREELLAQVTEAEAEIVAAHEQDMADLRARLLAADRKRSDANIARLRRAVEAAETDADRAVRAARMESWQYIEAEKVRAWAAERWPVSEELGWRRREAAAADAEAYQRHHTGTPRSRPKAPEFAG